MAYKTVEFMKIELLDRVSRNVLDYKLLRGIISGIIKNYAVIQSNFKILDLTPDIEADDIQPKIILDIFDDKTSIMFGRICKKKLNNEILQRDYTSLMPTEVFTPTEARRKGIEVFTYFIIDYDTGIISIANAKDAPGAGILNNMLDYYSSDYILRFINIPNEDGINLLYNSYAPEITRLLFEVPSPNPQFLQNILDLNEEEIMYIASENLLTVTLTLKPEPYKSLEYDTNKVRQIINILKSKKCNYKKAIIRGKSDEFGNKDFDLHAKYFTYPINIKKFKVVEGVKKEYNLDEITDQFKDGLIQAYRRNLDLLLAIADRENENQVN